MSCCLSLLQWCVCLTLLALPHYILEEEILAAPKIALAFAEVGRPLPHEAAQATPAVLWCCLKPEVEPQDAVVSPAGAHILTAADGKGLPLLARNLLSLAKHLQTGEGQMNVTVHWVVPAEVKEQASQLQDCIHSELRSSVPQLAVEVHALQDHTAHLPEKARARVRDMTLALVKFYMHDYLPSVDRVIWLEPAAILQADVRRLHAQPLDSAAAVTCHEGHRPQGRGAGMEEVFGRIANPRACFLHPGVMLVDLHTWRSSPVVSALEEWMAMPDVFMTTLYKLAPDKVVMNLHFQPGMIDVLDQRWNVFHVELNPETLDPCCLQKSYVFNFQGPVMPLHHGYKPYGHILNAHPLPPRCSAHAQLAA